jgi:glutamyl-Q tRNA(Asp) synthetase
MYTGRFAPSPTGLLHYGSLVAALASWLDARAAGGRWLVRIEDLDAPRSRAGMSGAILRQLDALALDWDGPVVYQSARLDRYRAALETLRRAGHAYWCGCTRKEIEDSVTRFDDAGAAGAARTANRVYPGACRDGIRPGGTPRAVRVRTSGDPIRFVDRVQGETVQVVEREVGDFVAYRGDGVHAYQLAVVVDDAEQGVTDVVRGADLLASTPRQILLQRLLGYATPRYLHLPVAVDETGAKLSKQSGAKAVPAARPADALRAALEFLGLGGAPASQLPRDVLLWARERWSAHRVPAVHAAPWRPSVRIEP